MSPEGPDGAGLLDDDRLIDLRRRARATDPAAVLAEEGRRTAMPAANAALRAWPTPTAAAPPEGGSATHAQPGRPDQDRAAAGGPALCGLCGTRPARGTCAMCGRGACAADLWVMLRLCRGCASEDAVARGQRGAKPEERNWLDGGRA